MKNLKSIVLYFTLQLILFSNAFAEPQKPELLIQKAHSTLVTTLELGANDKILVSGELNGTVKMWDLRTGLNVRSIELNSQLSDEIALNAGGRMLFTATVDECAFWDLLDGKKLQSTKCGDGNNYFSNRKFDFASSVFAASNQDSFDVVDIKNRKVIALEQAKDLTIHALEFGDEGKILAVANYLAADDDSQKSNDALKKQPQTKKSGFCINLYSVPSGEFLGKIEGLSGAVNSLAFNFDGQFLAGIEEVLTDDKKIIFLKLWNVISGEQVAVYRLGKDDLYPVLTTDGAIITTAANDVKVFRFDKGTLAPQTLKGKSEVVTAAAFASSGEILITGDMTGALKIWNSKGERETQSLGANVRAVSKVEIDPDSRQLFLAQKSYSFSVEQGAEYESEMKIFDFETGVKNKIFPKISNGIAVSDFSFGKDGKTFAVSGKSTTETRVKTGLINLGAVVGGTDASQTVVLKAKDGEVFTSLAFSPDGKTIATASTQSGTTAEGYVGSGDEAGTVKIWDAATGKLRHRLVGKRLRTAGGAEDNIVGFSPDGKTVINIDSDEAARFWDVETGKQIKTIDRDSDDLAEFFNFSPDATMLAFKSFGSDTERRKIKLLNVADGKIARTFAGHTGETSSVTFTADGKILISSSDDGTIKFWDVASEKEIANLIVIGADDWIVTTPEGLFDGTPAAWRAMLWRFENNPFNTAPIEAFFNEFYYPNLLQEIIAGRKPPPPARDLSSVDIRQPEIKITEIDGKQTGAKTTLSANSAKIKVKIEITDNNGKTTRPNFPASSGASSLRLFRNGSLVKLWNNDVFDLHEVSDCKQIAATGSTPRKTVCEAEVQITAGKNEFTAYAFNHDNVKSNDAVAEIKGTDSLKRSGTLYILAIGVNKYADATHNLKYAVADADAISAELAEQQKKLLQKQYAKTEIIKLTDERATQENIIFALEKFSANGFDDDLLSKTSLEVRQELAKIKAATPEDALVVYFAGHGTASKDRFYLIPHDGFPTSDAADKKRYEQLYAQSVSDESLQVALETADAGKILVIIDACNSGQALESEEKRRGPMNSKGLAQLAYEKGMYILTAAQSQQAALEVSKLGHGLLTFSLLEGMRNAEKNKDGTIFERKWLDYAVQKVPELQLDEMQKRDAETKKDPTKRDIGIVFVNGDNKNLPPEKRGLQSPRIFYRRELETNPLVVAKP